MTYFIKLEQGLPTGNPVVEENFRQLFPNTSFPSIFVAGDVEHLGYGIYEFCSKPDSAHNSVTHGVREIAPALTTKGHWEQRWEVYALSTEQAAANQAAAAKRLHDGIVQATQDRLDAFARERSYDDIKSASDYAGCSVPRFATEGTYCRDARAETWDALYTMLAEVQAGTRPMPSGFADIESELPALVWPTV